MKAFIMTVTFTVGVDILGFVKEWAHKLDIVTERITHGKNSKYFRTYGTRYESKIWVLDSQQGYSGNRF